MSASAHTQHLRVAGGTIAFDDTGGPGPLLVAAPGMGDLRGVYRFLVPRLAEAGYRVVTMDVRGHGETSTGWEDHSPEAVGEDMLALVRHLDAGPAILIGMSFTPASVVWAAARAPELVSGIVLIAPFASTPKLNPVLRLLSFAVTHSAKLWSDFFYKSLYPTAPPEDLRRYRDALRRNLREPGRMAALRAMAAAPKERANQRVPEVECPMLVLMGSKDPDFKDPEAEARLMAKGARDATVAMIDGAGH
jgi:pimeloyl-ACP methyl ester carboxylesterase